jgi:predicted Zn-dependent protease
LQALQAMPNSGATVVNHAVALIQAGRATEAAPLLSRAQSLSLDPSSQGMLAYAKVCYFSATGRPDEAWRQAQLLKTDDLFPSQIQQLETMLRHKLAGRP